MSSAIHDVVREIHEEAVVCPVTLDEFAELVEAKRDNWRGLLDYEGAALAVLDEVGGELPPLGGGE